MNGDGKITLEEFTSTIAEHYGHSQTKHTNGQGFEERKEKGEAKEKGTEKEQQKVYKTAAAKEKVAVHAINKATKAPDPIAETSNVGSTESKLTDSKPVLPVEQTDSRTKKLSPKASSTAAAVAEARAQANTGAGAGAGPDEGRKTLRQRKVEDAERQERELKEQAEKEADGGAWSDVEEASQPLGTNLDGPGESVADVNGAQDSPSSARERLASLSSGTRSLPGSVMRQRPPGGPGSGSQAKSRSRSRPKELTVMEELEKLRELQEKKLRSAETLKANIRTDIRKLDAKIRQSTTRRNVETNLEAKIKEAEQVKDEKQKDVDMISVELKSTDDKLVEAKARAKAMDAEIKTMDPERKRIDDEMNVALRKQVAFKAAVTDLNGIRSVQKQRLRIAKSKANESMRKIRSGETRLTSAKLDNARLEKSLEVHHIFYKSDVQTQTQKKCITYTRHTRNRRVNGRSWSFDWNE